MRAALLGLTALLLLSSCASPMPDPGPAPELPPHLADPPDDFEGWMRASSQAETRLDRAAAAYCMDRASEVAPERVDAAFLNRRAGLADQSGDREAGIAARRQLLGFRPDDLIVRIDLADDLGATDRLPQALEVLDYRFADAEDQRIAWEAAVVILERAREYGDAAGFARKLAQDPGEERNPRIWWQRASSLHERDGDFAAATEAIKFALEGSDLRREEEAALQRLRAFETGEARSVADGIALLRFHVDPELRLAGLKYLSGQKFDRDVMVFERALRDEDPRVVRGALAELAKRAEPGQVVDIFPLIQHEDPEVQLAAFEALGALGTEAEVATLIALMDPTDRARFRAARRAVEAVTDHAIGQGLDPNLAERQAIRQAWEVWLSERDGR